MTPAKYVDNMNSIFCSPFLTLIQRWVKLGSITGKKELSKWQDTLPSHRQQIKAIQNDNFLFLATIWNNFKMIWKSFINFLDTWNDNLYSKFLQFVLLFRNRLKWDWSLGLRGLKILGSGRFNLSSIYLNCLFWRKFGIHK